MNKRKHFLPRPLSLLLSWACRVRRLEPGDILLLCFAPRGHGRQWGVEEREEEKDRRRECVNVCQKLINISNSCVKHVKTQLQVLRVS